MRHLLLAVVLFFGLVSSLEAQVNKLSISRRQVIGVQEFATPTPVEAGDIVSPGDLIFISLNLQPGVRTDPSVIIRLNVFSSSDNGLSWQPIGGMTFKGDPDLPAGQRVGIGMGADGVLGKRIKAQVDSPVQRQIGLDIEIINPADLGF